VEPDARSAGVAEVRRPVGRVVAVGVAERHDAGTARRVAVVARKGG
jgi:hypothetical protein